MQQSFVSALPHISDVGSAMSEVFENPSNVLGSYWRLICGRAIRIAIDGNTVSRESVSKQVAVLLSSFF